LTHEEELAAAAAASIWSSADDHLPADTGIMGGPFSTS